MLYSQVKFVGKVKPELAEELGEQVPVVAVASTRYAGSAVASVPVVDQKTLFTYLRVLWSLMGVELDKA